MPTASRAGRGTGNPDCAWAHRQTAVRQHRDSWAPRKAYSPAGHGSACRPCNSSASQRVGGLRASLLSVPHLSTRSLFAAPRSQAGAERDRVGRRHPVRSRFPAAPGYGAASAHPARPRGCFRPRTIRAMRSAGERPQRDLSIVCGAVSSARRRAWRSAVCIPNMDTLNFAATTRL